MVLAQIRGDDFAAESQHVHCTLLKLHVVRAARLIEQVMDIRKCAAAKVSAHSFKVSQHPDMLPCKAAPAAALSACVGASGRGRRWGNACTRKHSIEAHSGGGRAYNADAQLQRPAKRSRIGAQGQNSHGSKAAQIQKTSRDQVLPSPAGSPASSPATADEQCPAAAGGQKGMSAQQAAFGRLVNGADDGAAEQAPMPDECNHLDWVAMPAAGGLPEMRLARLMAQGYSPAFAIPQLTVQLFSTGAGMSMPQPIRGSAW